MSMIAGIRSFLRLDKVSVSADTEFTDSVGLWIHEKDELMKEHVMQSCFAGGHVIADMPDAHSHHLILLHHDFTVFHL